MPSLPRYIAFSNSFSAWHLQRGLALLGKRLESAHPMLGFAPQITAPPRPGDILFFTDEAALLRYAGRSEFNFGPHIDTSIIDDKLAFASWLESIGESPVPYATLSAAVNAFPAVLKSRYSWRDGRRLPRGAVCHNRQQFDRESRRLSQRGVAHDGCFLQQYISGPRREYSTCGFFDARDPRRTAMIVVQRTASMTGDLPSGAIVETTPDPANLIARTAAMLAHLNYIGPFELEFLKHSDGSYFVLELNPRFWMQHGLFIDFFDNVLLRRYVDPVDATPLPHDDDAPPAVWLNGWYFLKRACRGDWRSLGAFAHVMERHRRGRVRAKWYPSWSAMARFAAHSPQRKLRQVLSEHWRRPTDSAAA